MSSVLCILLSLINAFFAMLFERCVHLTSQKRTRFSAAMNLLHCIVLPVIVCIVLYCIVLYCITLPYISHCTVLYSVTVLGLACVCRCCLVWFFVCLFVCYLYCPSLNALFVCLFFASFFFYICPDAQLWCIPEVRAL